MRRKAIKLANLRKCVTHSTQTVFSNFKRENETQVYLPKDNWGQTKRDGDTSVPKLKTYYHGLRYIFFNCLNLQPADCNISEEKPNLDHSNKSTLQTTVKLIRTENNPEYIFLLYFYIQINYFYTIQRDTFFQKISKNFCISVFYQLGYP